MATRIKIPVLIKLVEVSGYAISSHKSKKNKSFSDQVFNNLVFTSKDYRQPSNFDDLVALTYYGMLDPTCTAGHPSPFADAIKHWGIKAKFGVTIQVELAAIPVVARDNTITVDNCAIQHKKIYLYEMAPSAEEFEATMNNIVEGLPDKLASFVRSEAWDRGHSAGEQEVLMIARDLASKLI